MKKIFLLAMVFICILTTAFADETYKDEVSFKATITGNNEVPYYIESNGNDVVGGKLSAGSEIEIYYEKENEDGTIVFYFITPNETNESKWTNIKKIYKESFVANTNTISKQKLNLSKESTNFFSNALQRIKNIQISRFLF